MTGSRCNVVRWLPDAAGRLFLSAHADGSIVVWDKGPKKHSFALSLV